MFKLLARPNIIRRFSHTSTKTIFTENNNKIIEDLMYKQNKYQILGLGICFGIFITVTIFKK